nr:hypothetical protein [Tanacetum cinerariifolium]
MSSKDLYRWYQSLMALDLGSARVLVNKSHNKTSYELFNGRIPAIGFLKPFGCHVMILNTLDNLGKFEAKGDEGYFIGYSMSIKAFKVFNKRIRRIEENFHVEFLENKAIKKGAGPNCGNPNPTASSSNPLTDQRETLTVESPIPTVSSPVPTACLNDSPKLSSEARLISKRVANQKETPSLENILSLTNRFDDILRVSTLTNREDFILVLVYVDDIIFGSSNPQLCREFEALMHKKFQMSAMGDILKKFRFSDVRSSNTPMDKENPWGKDGTGKDVELHLYRSMIGSLMYLTATRPDIMFAVCAYARHQVTPKECHLYAVKRIFRYLKGHPKLGLWYPKASPFDLVAYSDSDYGGASQDRKSTTGGSQFLGRRLISWQCKKQTIVATSTTKAEYVVAASNCRQVL